MLVLGQVLHEVYCSPEVPGTLETVGQLRYVDHADVLASLAPYLP